MNNKTFWESINRIISDGFDSRGLKELEDYAELFITEKSLFKRFSPAEQHGCSAGGPTHVIATILAGAKDLSDIESKGISDFKRELQLAEIQIEIIENWAKKSDCWIPNVDNRLKETFGPKVSEGGEATVYDNGPTLIKTIGLDYYILPSLALDRISLHNTFFPETLLSVIGFGKDEEGRFKIVVEQPFVKGSAMTEAEIEEYALNLGFELRDRRS